MFSIFYADSTYYCERGVHGDGGTHSDVADDEARLQFRVIPVTMKCVWARGQF